MSILCLTDIRADRCATSAKLVGYNIFFFKFKLFDEIYDLNRNNDCVLNLLSDILTPLLRYYNISFSEAQSLCLA